MLSGPHRCTYKLKNVLIRHKQVESRGTHLAVLSRASGGGGVPPREHKPIAQHDGHPRRWQQYTWRIFLLGVRMSLNFFVYCLMRDLCQGPLTVLWI